MIAVRRRLLAACALLVTLVACGATPPPETLTVDATPTASASTAASPAPDRPFAVAKVWERPLDANLWPLVQRMVRGPRGEVAIAIVTSSEVDVVVLWPDGKPKWETHLREAGAGFAHFGGMGFDAESNLVVGGQFAQRLEVSGKEVADAGAEEAVFVVSFDGSGGVRWSKAIHGNGLSIPTLRASPRGESILLAGAFRRDITLEDKALEGSGAGDGVAGSLYLARLDPSGAVLWSRLFPGNAMLNEVVDDGAGHVLIAGDFFGSFAIDGFRELVGDGDRGRGSYMIQIEGPGAPRWLKPVGAQGITATSDGSYFFCGGPWERFGRKRLGAVRPGGGAGPERATGLLTCNGVAVGNDGHLLVYGSIQRGEADPKSGGVNTSVRVLDVTREGVVVSGVTLPLDSTGSSPLVVADGKDGALVASAFRVDDAGALSLILYRLSR